jgi:hypothetical protein
MFLFLHLFYFIAPQSCFSNTSCDKSGLGYKQEDTHAEASTSNKLEVSPLKKEDNVTKQPSTQSK